MLITSLANRHVDKLLLNMAPLLPRRPWRDRLLTLPPPPPAGPNTMFPFFLFPTPVAVPLRTSRPCVAAPCLEVLAVCHCMTPRTLELVWTTGQRVLSVGILISPAEVAVTTVVIRRTSRWHPSQMTTTVVDKLPFVASFTL